MTVDSELEVAFAPIKITILIESENERVALEKGLSQVNVFLAEKKTNSAAFEDATITNFIRKVWLTIKK